MNNGDKNQVKPVPVAATRKAANAPKSLVKVQAVPKAKSIAKANPVAKTKPIKQALKTKAAPVLKEKVKKTKLVRDSFTMPEAEYAALGEVKKLCLKAGIEVKKSELLRIGVAHIRQLSLLDLKKSIATLVPLKAGRPKKEK